jgi:cell wall-associated NlpC family hydrolase
MHWAERYIGLPWESGAQGPAAYDCWALFRYVQQVHYGRSVPFINVDAMDVLACARAMEQSDERMRWCTVDVPSDGDAVLMGKGRHPVHIGVWLDVDGGGVLHAQQGAGVLFTRRSALGLMGWQNVTFYRYAGESC